MNHSKRLSVVLLLMAGGLVFSTITPASARGGGSNIMMSPGYQRALQESRERYRQSATQQRYEPSAVHKRKKSRHHRKHH